MKIKFSILFSFLALTLTPLTTSAEFFDVPTTHPNHQAIDYVQSQGIVEGYPDGSYQANRLIQRDEFTKIVAEATLEDSTFKNCTPVFEFSDVSCSNWSGPYIYTAQNHQLVKGYTDQTFRPANNINFVEAAKIIAIAYGEPENEGEIWYENYVNFLEENNAVPPSISSNDQLITRGEMAEMIYRVEIIDQNLDQTNQTDPNVLLIILDDIGLDYFPGFLEKQEFDKAPMPVVESLMDEGYVFTNLHTYSMCSPTRASLLTGHHGVETGVLDPGATSYLDPQWQSIQEELKVLSNGEIATAVFGKWHLLGRQGGVDHPNLFGVDHYEGIVSGNHESYSNWNKVTNGVESVSTTYSTTDFTNAAINWINAQNGPWFTWLAYTAPHSPIHLPPSDLHSFDQLSGEENDLKKNKALYFMAMLESVDTEIGRLLDSMDAQTRANTYVMVIGDNGTGGNLSQEPFKSVGGKGSLQKGGIHTPMVVYNPYLKGNGKQLNPLVSTIDFYPTLLEIFNVSSNSDLPGNSLSPLISTQENTYVENEYVYSQNLEAAMVRSKNYKLIRFNEGEERFYNLILDPFEESNLMNHTLSIENEIAYQELSEALEGYLGGVY